MFNKNTGFTLIELLVVIAIIGTLSGIVLVSLGGARKKARDAVRQSDMRQVISAQELYYGDNEIYATAGASSAGTPAVGTYLQALHDSLPTQDYHWIDNTAVTGTCTSLTQYSALPIGQCCHRACLTACRIGSCQQRSL